MNYHLPISSERIDYQQLGTADYDAWVEFFVDNPMLPYVGISQPGDPVEEAKKWVNRQLNRYIDNGWGYLKMVEKTTGEVVGHTGLLLREIDGQEQLEIGYSIKPRFWRMGYASEASQRMKAYMVEHKVMDKAISIIHFDNIGSQRVAERNGMTRGREWEYMGMPVYIYEADL